MRSFPHARTTPARNPSARPSPVRPPSTTRPSARFRRGLAAAALVALTACAGPSGPVTADAPGADAARPTATALDFTETLEIRFADELVGYLVHVLEVPDGVLDQRAFPPGTALLEDPNLDLVGFISRHGTSYRFREDGTAEAVGFGTRDANIAAFFGRRGVPVLRSLHPGTVPGA